MLIARDKEKLILQDSLKNEYSQFIAVYGRRRIGKTFLIRESFNYQFTFEHSGLANGSLKEELEAFCNSLKDAGMKDVKTPSNWLEAFELLKDLIRSSKERKKVIFIDELSWMDTRKCDLMIALEGFWNGWASARKDIVLVICASATSWMLKKVIHNKGGLYNRLNYRIGLKPFNLNDCENFLQSKSIVMNRKEILEAYMIFGGIPYYWNFIKKGQSLSQNIDDMFFSEDAPLKDEFNYLYASIFRQPKDYISIITALGKKKIGMTREELVEATKIPNSGSFSTKLEELESCGFIRRYNSFGKQSKNALFQLIDNFTLFYFKFMTSKNYDTHFWTHQINTPAKNSWCGLAFERVCLEHVAQIKKKLGISGVYTEVFSWSCKEDLDTGLFGSQIDLLIVRKDQVINLCEMKFSDSEYTINKKTDEQLRNKISDLITATKTKFSVHLTLVAPYGLKMNLYSGNVQSVVNADALFERV